MKVYDLASPEAVMQTILYPDNAVMIRLALSLTAALSCISKQGVSRAGPMVCSQLGLWAIWAIAESLRMHAED